MMKDTVQVGELDVVTNDMVASIKVDAEFKARIPALTPDELALLEENLKTEGCRDPIITWGDMVVDGHHRLEICQRLGIPFRCQTITLDCRADALLWIDRNQLGRRNITAQQRMLIVGRLYNATKPAQGGTGANQSSGSHSESGNSARALGTKHKLSERQVRRSAKFAKAADADPELLASVMRGDKPKKRDAKRSFSKPVKPDAAPVGQDAAPVNPDAAPVNPDAAPIEQDGAPVKPDAAADVKRIEDAAKTLEVAWTSATQDTRDQFISVFKPTAAFSELMKALSEQDRRRSQTGHHDRSAAAVKACHGTTTVIGAVPVLAKTDEPPVVSTARKILESIGELGLDEQARSTVRCVSGDIIRKHPNLEACFYENIVDYLRTGNADAKILADQIALHWGADCKAAQSTPA